MLPFLRCLALACALLATAASAAPPMPQGVTGNYYNPAQSGHGVNVEVLDDERAIVYWHTYDHDGNPMPLYMEGRIDDNRITGTAYAPRGMRFGEFDRARLQAPRWGELALVFDSCASGRLHWSTTTAFGSGSTPLQRLAYSSACPGGALIPIGRLSGRVSYPPWGNGLLWGMVLADGSLYATVGPHWPLDAGTRVLAAETATGTTERVLSPAKILSNGFLCRLADPACVPDAPESLLLPFERTDAGVQARIPSDGSLLQATVHPEPAYLAEAIVGVFHFDTEARDLGRWQLVLGAGGEMCVRAVGTPACLYDGRAERTDYGLYTFEVQRAGSDEPPFRGYLLSDFTQVFIGPFDLHIVGSNGETGMAFHARFDHRR